VTHCIHRTSGVAEELAAAAAPAQIAVLSAAVTATPDIDPVLVAVLRQTIERGEYRIDARRVAHKMALLDGI
jgi:flagellar biosynthesis anti-sigma factor FlgM